MRLNIPTILTISRMVLIPFLISIFYLPFSWAHFVCALVFLFASITDWLDGYLARRWREVTHLGKFLDPVADKLIAIVAMMLVAVYYSSFLVTLSSTIMISREIIIVSLREWLTLRGKHGGLPVSGIGKTKTTIQMVALTWMIYCPKGLAENMGVILFCLAAIFTVLSMLFYLISVSNYIKC